MPNWVTNSLSINGPEDQKAKFFEVVRGEEAGFDFSSIMPMPESLRLVAGGHDELAIYAALLKESSREVAIATLRSMSRFPSFLSDERFVKMDDEIDHLMHESNAFEGSEVVYDAATSPETYIELLRWGKVYVSNYRKYGCLNWYEWCNENWGSKWNACDVESDEDSGIVSFMTAWAPPDGIAEALPGVLTSIGAKDVTVEWQWAEEQGYYGGIFYINADAVAEANFENSEEAYDLCEELLGYSARDYEDEDE